jgi:hypothetical protein
VSAVLPTDTTLGSLQLDEVFVEYEGPKLFTARNAAGQRFLAVAVDEEDQEVSFLYVPMSASRYLSVRSGLMSLRDAILDAEESVLVVTSDYVRSAHRATRIASEDIREDWLPDRDAALDIPTLTQKRFEPQELTVRANGETRSLLALQLDRPDLMRTEYPLRDLKDLLEDVQEAVHAMAAEAEDKATTAGSIPEYIVRDSELSLVDLQAASFVVVLAPTLGDRMVEMPLATVAAQRLLSLLATVDDEDHFRQAVADLQQRAFTKVRSLLEDLVDTNASVRVYFAHPGQDLRETGLSSAQAGRGLEILSEASTTSREVYIERAVLIGANVRTRAFELRDESTGEKYAGKVEQEALPQIDGLQLGEGYRYSARVFVEESFGSASSEPKAVHRLQMIRRATEAPDVSPYAE